MWHGSPPPECSRSPWEKIISYLNSVPIIGFVGADPEQRQARNGNGSKFTIISVATQRARKNAEDDWASKTEWHRVCIFRPKLAEYALAKIRKGSHVLIDGTHVSTNYERPNGRSRKSKREKQTFWCIRADVVRRLDRGEPELETLTTISTNPAEPTESGDPVPF